MPTHLIQRLAMSFGLLLASGAYFAETVFSADNSGRATADMARGYRGPVDLVIAADASWAVSVNELANSLSLIDLKEGKLLGEVSCAARPAAVKKISESELLVTCFDAGVCQRFAVDTQAKAPNLRLLATIPAGGLPQGLAIDAERQLAFVGLQAEDAVAEIDLRTNQLVRTLPVGKWPRYLALSPDGSRLAVGLSGQSSIAVLDARSGELLYEEPLSGGINIGHMVCSADGRQVYFPWMIYRSNPITVGNIRRGWVLASRLARVSLDGPSYREAIALDVPRRAVADPHGLALTPDESRIAVTSAGTHELLVYGLPKLPFVGTGGPGDLIDEQLMRNPDLFTRIELGGRPLGIVAGPDNRTVYIANHTADTVQVVDLTLRQVTGEISLGEPPADKAQQTVHRGLEIFHDATRSLDQWYSCASCHLDGGSNAKAMDTWNDGSELTVKTVLPLAGVLETGPWTWHGWQTDLDESIQNSFVSTMQGPEASSEDIAAVRAYLAQLTPAPNPFARAASEILNDSSSQNGIDPSQLSQKKLVELGKQLFHSSAIGCADCHSGPHFTDGQIHDVGLSRSTDAYAGYNTPSLKNVYRKARWLHDGRAKSLATVLTEWHTPQEVGGGGSLDESQLRALIAYLKTL